MTKPDNPWLNICWENRIATCDNVFLISKGMTEKLQLDTLPEPYTGNPNADVYCLGMNPGEKDCLFECSEENRQLLLEYTQKTLAHEIEDNIWNLLTEHSGYCWWRYVTRELRKELRRDPKMFIIEYFPYHSQKGFYFPQNMPSYDYSDWLVRNAIESGKYILAMRHTSQWTSRIKELKTYPKFFYINPKNTRCLLISRENILKGEKCEFEIDNLLEHF